MSRPLLTRVVVVGWLALLATTTVARLPVWQSDATLWRDARAKAPTKPRPVLNDARVHELAGDLAAAEDGYRTVILLSFDPHRPAYIRKFSLAAAETNLAHMAMKEGRFATALRILDNTLEAWPDFPYAHYNRAAIFWHVGACDAAAAEYSRAMAYDPQLPHPEGACVPSPSTP